MSVENLRAKQAVIDEIKGKLEKAQSAVVIDYMGITVDEANAMRKRLREADVDYTVYKNTLVSRAIKGTAFESLEQVLNGPSAFAFGYEDAIAPARTLNNIIKDLKKMEFKAGVVDGEFYDKNGIIAIASLPSRDELIAKFMGSIKSPVSNFAYLLQAISDQKAAGVEPPAKEATPVEEAPAAVAPVEEAPAEAVAPVEEAPAEEAVPAEEAAPAEEETPAE